MSNEQKLKIPGPRSAPHDRVQRRGLQRLTPASQTPPSSENQNQIEIKTKSKPNQKSNQNQIKRCPHLKIKISPFLIIVYSHQLNSLINTPFSEIQIITLFNQDHSNILSVLSQSLSLLMFNKKRPFANSVADLAY